MPSGLPSISVRRNPLPAARWRLPLQNLSDRLSAPWARPAHASEGRFSYNDHIRISFCEDPMSDVQQWIKETVTANPVVLFMKGNAQFPQCGFSGRAVQLLKACGVDNIVTINVLEDPAVRQGIKEYSNWPTIPQLYVKGEFVGGSDIMNEMFESGELQALLKS
jgi:monothiol glutaredoxin